jgi:hypothetical protein
MRIATRSLALAVTVAALASAASLSAAAPASATTWHHTQTYLHFPPRSADAVSMRPRTITLNGTYRWRAFTAHTAHEDRPRAIPRIVTLHGRYEWHDAFYISDGHYRRYSSLVNVRTLGRVSIDFAQPATYGTGKYHWGSTLDNVRAR